MTASDPTAVDELPRPVPDGPAPDVAQEVWHALRAVAAARETERESATRRVESVRADLDRLAQVATEVAYQLRAAGDGMAEELLAGVRRAGLVVLDPVGEPLTEDWADLVEIAHSAPDGAVTGAVVREVWRPGLMTASGRVVRRAVVALAVPATPNPGQEAES